MTTIINMFTMYLFFIRKVLAALSFESGPKHFIIKNVPIELKTKKVPMLMQPFQATV